MRAEAMQFAPSGSGAWGGADKIVGQGRPKQAFVPQIIEIWGGFTGFQEPALPFRRKPDRTMP
jgi:hypothetical protein